MTIRKIISCAALLIFLRIFSVVTAHAAYSPAPGDLVKADLPAVYYVTADGKRLAFPNEATYFSWYKNFSAVKIISNDELAALPLSGLATIRPGVMIKAESSPVVYAVAHGGTLRILDNETIAQMIFGADWSKKVITVPDVFLTAYKYGVDITGAGQYWWSKENAASPTIVDDLNPAKSPDAVAPAAPIATPPVTPATSYTENQPSTTNPPGTASTAKNVLFILWDPKRLQDSAFDKTTFERVIFGQAPSIADYYNAQSGGKVSFVNAGVLGWYSADYPPEHYWTDDPLIHESDGYLTGAAERDAEAVTKANIDFNFKKYDANGDGKLTPDELSVFIVIPESGEPVDDIVSVYSNEKTSAPMSVDGVTLGTVGELYVGAPLGVGAEFGTIAHGFAKYIFALPDLSSAVGDFSLMSAPQTDLNIDPNERIAMGWLKPKIITKFQEISDQQLVADGSAIRIDRDQPGGPAPGSEYFLLENRERGIYDNSLPDTGIAVWDINGGSTNLVRLNSGPAEAPNDAQALWHLGSSTPFFVAQELHWSDNARSGVQMLNLGMPSSVMSFTLIKKNLTEQDLSPISVPSPLQ